MNSTQQPQAPQWKGGDETKLGRWGKPYWDSRDRGGWVVCLRGYPGLSPSEVAVGLLDVLTAPTEEILRRKMREQDERFKKHVTERMKDLPTWKEI